MKTFIRLTLAITALTLLPTAARAEEKSPSLRLIELMEFTKTAKLAAASTIAPMVQQLKTAGVPDEAIKEISAAADRFFAKTFDNPDFIGEIAKVYENTFSKEEMEELIVFYNTPVGRKSLQSMPQIMQEGAKVGQKYAAQNQAEFQAEVNAIMAKYKKDEPAPAAE